MNRPLARNHLSRRRLWRWAAGGAAAVTVSAPSGAEASSGRQEGIRSPADLDAATAAQVRNAASRTRAALAETYATWVEVPASLFGALGDGITDDGAALNAAAAAAADVGGVVVLDRQNATYLIKSQLTVPSFVGLRGFGSLNLNGARHPISTIRLGGPDAAVVFGNPVLDATHPGVTTFCPYAGKFDIDANNTGQPAGALRFEGVNQIFAENIGVTDAAGTGCRIASGQNSTYDQIVIHHSGRGGSGDGFHITGGAGGNVFSRLYCRDTSADGAHLNVTKDAGLNDVYSNGPSHNLFEHCIFESTRSTGSLVRITDGGVNVFDSCLFAGPDTRQDPDQTLGSGAAVTLPGAPWVEFDSCHFVAVGNAMRIAGAAQVKVSGFSVFQTTQPLFKIDNCAPQLNLSQPRAYVIDQPLVELVGTGSAVGFSQDVVEQTTYRYSPDNEPNAGKIRPWAIARHGEAQPRWYVGRDGAMGWGPGGSTVPAQTLTRDPAYGMVHGGGLRVDGRVATRQPAVANAGGTATYALDSGEQMFHRYGFAKGGAAKFVLTNPQPGSEVALQIIISGTTVPTVKWPPNARFAGGKAPTLTAKTVTTVTWRYDADWALWWEISRAAGVPIS